MALPGLWGRSARDVPDVVRSKFMLDRGTARLAQVKVELEEEKAENAEEKVAETAANTVSRDTKHGKAIAICSYVFKAKALVERKSAPSIKTLADCAVAMVDVVNATVADVNI